MIDVDSGRVLSQHQGIHTYTYAQSAHISGLNSKYYVCEIDASTNTLLLVCVKALLLLQAKNSPCTFELSILKIDCPLNRAGLLCRGVYCFFNYLHPFQFRCHPMGNPFYMSLEALLRFSWSVIVYIAEILLYNDGQVVACHPAKLIQAI